jgi:hypothetical protein
LVQRSLLALESRSRDVRAACAVLCHAFVQVRQPYDSEPRGFPRACRPPCFQLPRKRGCLLLGRYALGVAPPSELDSALATTLSFPSSVPALSGASSGKLKRPLWSKLLRFRCGRCDRRCSLRGASHEVSCPFSVSTRAGPPGLSPAFPRLPKKMRSSHSLCLSACCSVLRVSHPLDGLLPARARRPYWPLHLACARASTSCRLHSWGFLPFEAFPSFRSRNAFRRPPPSCRSRESRLFQLHACLPYGAPGSEPESPTNLPGTEASRSLARLQGLVPRPELPAAPSCLTAEQAPMRDSLTELLGSLGLWASSRLCPSRPGSSASSRPPPMRFFAAVCRPSRRKTTWPHR